MINAEQLLERIEGGIPGAQVNVRDLGGGNHWNAVVVAEVFDGKSLVERHKMVYATVRDRMLPHDDSIHALQLETHTPAEAQQRRSPCPTL